METPAIGDLKGLSSNAKTMVKMSVLSAWAELQVASTEQAYLVEVVKPHTASLTPLWLSSLQEFARLRFEPDISSSIGINGSDGLDTIYAAFNRQTLLKVAHHPLSLETSTKIYTVLPRFLAQACRSYCKPNRPRWRFCIRCP